MTLDITTMKLNFYLFLTFGYFLSVAWSKEIGQSEQPSRCIYAANGLCLPMGYNNLRKPNEYQDVNVMIRVAQISEVSDKHATVDLLTWLTFTWEDNRLIIMDENKILSYYDLQHDWLQNLWLPDVYVVGLKEVNNPGLIQSDQICKLQRMLP